MSAPTEGMAGREGGQGRGGRRGGFRGEDGKEGDRSPEHDGKEVKGDGTEEEFGAPYVFKPGEDRASREGASLAFDGGGTDHADENEKAAEHDEGEEID